MRIEMMTLRHVIHIQCVRHTHPSCRYYELRVLYLNKLFPHGFSFLLSHILLKYYYGLEALLHTQVDWSHSRHCSQVKVIPLPQFIDGFES